MIVRRFLLVVVAALLVSVVTAQTSWGVRVDVDLPADQSVVEFVANPVAYAQSHRDVLDVRAFVETGRVGLEGRYRSSTEAFVGAYYVLSANHLFGQAMESSIGIYAGRDFRAGAYYLSVRGSILLYGQLP